MTLSRIARTLLAASLSTALAGSLFAMPAAAAAEDGGQELYEQAALPSRFDLRDRGVVTPVKRQDPWSTCWSFGAIAAAETSILSTMGSTYEDSGFDLSERHLIYFSMNPVSSDDPQRGEGLYHLGNEGNPNAAYRTANSIVSSTLFSSGVAPLFESDYPYQNRQGMTEYEYMKAYPDEWMAKVKSEVEQSHGKTIDQLIAENEANPNYPKSEAEYLQNSWESYLKTVEDSDNYTEYLDWSIDQSQRDLTIGLTLIDGNKLPEYAECDNKGNWTGLSAHAVQATKKELQDGRAVAVNFHANSSTPSDSTTTGKYIDLNNWTHYTYDNSSSNHTVTIVGWDDNYPRENFLSGTDKRGNSKTPPANGAWIVKNSWGSETDAVSNEHGRPITKGTWGVKDGEGKSTGYFYLSYYDKSVKSPESFRFGTDMSESDYFSTYQYDCLPADDGFYFATGDSRISTANIFVSDP